MTVRAEWLDALLRIVSPVLDALEEGRLKEKLPLGFHPQRAGYAPLEAFGRSLTGLAPWLEADTADLDAEEAAAQARLREKALHCLDMATDPASPDRMLFDEGGQPLVDAAFLSHGLLRAQKALAAPLDGRVRQNLAEALRATRQIVPRPTNWLLFSAMAEAGLYLLGEDWDRLRVLSALRSFEGWYVGDGTYGDGAAFHWDYYNSYVIHPMQVDLTALFAPELPEAAALCGRVKARAARYAQVLEHLIAPDGSYPLIGRSICYRFGAFHLLSQAALEGFLMPPLTPASVRCALTAVLRRVMSAPGLFDAEGFLRPGVYGYQPELAEEYINTGSLYLCTALFLPLGLSPRHAFWSGGDEAWTGLRAWRGETACIDHAQD